MMKRKISNFVIIIFVFGVLTSLIGILQGNPNGYYLGSFFIFGSIFYFIALRRQNSLSLLLIVILFLYIRYIPLIKTQQPLPGDALADLTTATVFLNENMIKIYQDTFRQSATYVDTRISTYSAWPLVHIFAIMFHDIVGFSLYSVFVFLPPIVAFPSLLFMYLLVKQFFGEKAALISCLIFTTFSIIIYWQMQLVRQNLAFTLMIMALSLYGVGINLRSRRWVALSLLIFTELPFAHHLTVAELMAIIVVVYLASLFEKIYRKSNSLDAGFPKFRYSIFVFLVIILSTLVNWLTYSSNIIIPLLITRFYDLLTGSSAAIGNIVIEKAQQSFRIFDILSDIRLVLLGLTSVFGLFLMIKNKEKYLSFIIGLTLIPLVALLMLFFGNLDDRHMLFLMFPVSILTSYMIIKLTKKRILVQIILFIILLPTPFKLYTTFKPAPTWIYDNSQSYIYYPHQPVEYRKPSVFAACSWTVQYQNTTSIVSDESVGFLLLTRLFPERVLFPTHIYYKVFDLLIFNVEFINNYWAAPSSDMFYKEFPIIVGENDRIYDSKEILIIARR